jgi:TonB family protein
MRFGAQLLLTVLLNAFWQIALVAGFAVVCDWLLTGTAARHRHAVWVAALFIAAALPALSSASLIKTLPRSQSRPQVAATASEPVFVTRMSSPDLDSLESSAPAELMSPAAVATVRRNFLASPIHLNRTVALLMVGLYALFFLFRMCQLIRAWQRTKRIVQGAFTFAYTAPVETIIKNCQKAIGVQHVRILGSTSVPVPVTVGIFKPMIILPEHLLRDIDEEVLTTAIGHELVHVSRRDYLANLVYELIYLPLSFHPAMALVRRRIKQTRELCCDESVANKLLRPETYARSLVRLIGSTPLGPRLAADTTIGLSESDILEIRIMSLLKTPKLTARRKRLLLISATLLLVAPCVAATAFALSFDISQRQDVVALPSAATTESQNQERLRLRAELQHTLSVLKEQKRVAPQSERPEIEARLREVQKNLEELERISPDAEARLQEAQRSLQLHDRRLQEYYQQNPEQAQKRLEDLRARLAQWEKYQPANEARIKEAREQLAQMEKLYTPERERDVEKTLAEMQKVESDRKARVIYRVEPEYTPDAREKNIEGTVVLTLTIDHEGLPQNVQVKKSLYPSLDQSAIEAARKMRFEPAIKNGQPVSMFISVEFNFAIESRSKQELEEIEKRAVEARAAQGEYSGREMKMRRDTEQQGRAERARDLTRGAVLSMDRAIQIATSLVPGKVLACSLGRDGDKIFYHVVIIGGDGDKSTTTYVWVSALDGQVLKTEKEEPRKEEEAAMVREPGRQINGGVLNGKATSLPQPVYPLIARQAHASGEVIVQVTIDETGNIVSAHAVSGHPLLQAAAVTAARQASFSATRLNGEPVKVSGVLVYTFTQ